MFADCLITIDGNEINPNSRIKITIFKKSNHFRKTKNDNTPFPKRPAKKNVTVKKN